MEDCTAIIRPPLTSQALVELAVRTLMAGKALDLVVLEVKELCSFADYFIVASGTSRRQVQALAHQLEEAQALAGVKPLGEEGIQEGVWVLLDYNDVVIHLFSEALRDFYNLEGLWSEAPRITLDIKDPGLAAAVSATTADPQPLTDPDQTHHG